MTAFPEMPNDDYDLIYLANTDKALPLKLNQGMRYAYFKTIARGGKAIIQSCKDLYLSRTICYKKLRPEFAEKPLEQRRFLREARVSALLQHPGTIPAYELGRDSQGHYYFTMKLVHGYTLREVLNYRERYDLPQLINVIIRVAQALEYAHNHRVIHRDIKPENILVGPFGEVLLMDWGLAKVWNPDGSHDEAGQAQGDAAGDQKASSMTETERLQGTVYYMSPEQLQRDPDIDFRADIYSLGVVLYEILTGRLPADGDTITEVRNKTLSDSPPRPSAIAPFPAPRLLEEVTMSCLAKSVEERLHDCGELVRLLEEDWD